jgi:hypothetical protein
MQESQGNPPFQKLSISGQSLARAGSVNRSKTVFQQDPLHPPPDQRRLLPPFSRENIISVFRFMLGAIAIKMTGTPSMPMR